MLKLHVYDADTHEIVAVITGDNNDDCEFLAGVLYPDTDYYGWSYTDNELTWTGREVELTLPDVGDTVTAVGYDGEWEVVETDYKPNNHNILIKNSDRGEMWVSADAIDYLI